MYWNRGWQVFFTPRYLLGNVRNWFARVTADFALNRFIFRRNHARGLAPCADHVGLILPAVGGRRAGRAVSCAASHVD